MSEQCFFTAGAIRAEEHFFGREKETREVLELLRRDQLVFIVGPRRIGKSSLLHHISKPAVFEAHRLVKTRHRFIYIECCDLVDLDPSESRVEIVHQAQREIPEVDLSLPSGSASSVVILEFYRFFESVKKAGLRCIIMLDHFESLIENPRLDHVFLRNLRAMNSMYQVLYVIASPEPLSQLGKTWLSQRGQTSPFFNIFHQCVLGPFSQDESRAFLRQRFDSVCLSVPNSAVDLVLNWARGHPYFLQSAGAFIVSLLSEGQVAWSKHFTNRLRDYLVNLSESESL